MKKILVTGAAGSIGRWVLKYLLSEGKYEITAVDLKNKQSFKKLKRYHKRINVVYGDVEDQVLMDALIKDHDYVIHLAGIMPPLCNLSKSFGENIDYKGTENIVRSISFYNPECFLIFPSTTSIYESKTSEVASNSKELINESDYYSLTKDKCEKLIKEKLKNYVIFRIPFVLGEFDSDKSIYLYKKDEEVEVISNRDAAYALTKTIEYKKELNKKTKILSGGPGCRVNTNELYKYILDTYGYSFDILWNKLFNTYTYSGNIYKQDKKLEELLKYQNDSVASYFMRLKRSVRNRNIQKLFAKPLIKRLEGKYQK